MTTTDHTAHIAALAAFLGIEPDTITPQKWDHYGLPLFEAEGKDYAVGTDSEADEAATESIRGSLWAFNPSFICSMCDLPSEFEDGIKAMQEKCEDANEPLLALVEKLCGLETLVDHALQHDGRGHFMSSYDGEENEQEHEGETFYIYRIN